MYIIYKKSKVQKEKVRVERFTSNGEGVSFFKDIQEWKKNKEEKEKEKENDIPKTS